MKKETYCICEKCFHPIIERTEGVIIRGNIYIADPIKYGGLIGNNFPKNKEFKEIDIKEVAYHINCLFEILKNTK